MTLRDKKQIEAIYGLSPMQQGMLFHNLYAPKSEEYFQQMVLHLRGHVDGSCLTRAWQRVVDRHPILRTAFVWEGLEKPMQVVHRKLPIAVDVVDLGRLGLESRHSHFEDLLAADRRRGFELTKAPLMRFKLIVWDDQSYRFIWSHHHLLLDGWSLNLVLQEVFLFYRAFSENRDLLRERPRPFREYITWLKQRKLDRAEAFWRKTLAGFSTPTPLAFSPHVEPQTTDASPIKELSLNLSASENANLLSFTRERGLTLNTLVLAAWSLLLSRYSGCRDVMFGATVSGRPPSLPNATEMIGLFINTLPVRIEIPSGGKVSGWLADIQALLVEIREYEYSPLVKVQEWSDIPAGTSMFESLILFENYSVDHSLETLHDSLAVEAMDFIEKTNYPLNLIVNPGASMTLRLAYDKSRFNDVVMERLFDHFKGALQQLVAAEKTSPAGIELLDEEEQRSLLHGWNQTLADYPAEEAVHELLRRQADTTPDRIAIDIGGKCLSYAAFERRADEVARAIAARGLMAEQRIALCMTRSADMVIAILATLKSGCAYVPVDPNYPPARVDFMLADSGAQLLLTRSADRERLGDPDLPVMLVDHANTTATGHPPCLTHGGDRLAYMIYTSGSTGLPKGVQITHRAMVNFLMSMGHSPGLQEQDRFLAVTSFSFDIAVLELFLPLLTGGRLVIAQDAATAQAEALAGLLERHCVTAMQATPATWRMLLDGGWLGGPRLKALCGGEGFPKQLAADLNERCASVWNMYGPTETTIWSAIQPLSTDLTEGKGTVVIGKPIANTTLYLRDRLGELAPAGIAARLFIGGDGLARGYFKRPGLTAVRFVPDPFGDRPGRRLYDSGDLARLDGWGHMEVLGRVDNQIKIRGFRIELGEIEAVLERHPLVSQAVALADNREVDGELRAFAVTEDTQAVAALDWRGRLGEHLPHYMLPNTVTAIETLPTTPNGKIDRRALLTKVHGEATAATHTAPRTPEEEILAGIWAEVLGRERVGIHEDFFALGGHSLRATQLVSRMRTALSVEVPLRTLFEQPTIATLSGHMESMGRPTTADDGLDLVPVARDRELPLSFAQQRLWFLHNLASDIPTYNLPAILDLEGQLDFPALFATLAELVRRQESLRTRFAMGDDAPIQIVDPPGPLSLPIIDLGALSEEERTHHWEDLTRREVRRPFDLESDPGMRKFLIWAGKKYRLVLTFHHIVYDAWSSAPLVAEAGALYQAFRRGDPSPLPDLPIQYPDFAFWQRRWLQGERLENQLGFWRGKLAGKLPVLDLPSDRPRTPTPSYRGALEDFEIPLDLIEEMGRFSRKQGVTEFMTLLTAFMVLLHRYSRQDDLIVGCDIANRNRTGLEQLIGFFVNMLPVRGNFSGNPSFKTLLKQIRRKTLDAYAHQDVPFEMLVDALKLPRDPSRNPLFQVNVVYQNIPGKELTIDGLVANTTPPYAERSPFDMTLYMVPEPTGLYCGLVYSTDLFDDWRIKGMLAHFQQLLEGIVANPDRPIASLPMMSAETFRELTLAWNQTELPYDHHRRIHEVFENLARQNPDQPALRFGDERLTYAELNGRANQIAHKLRSVGVGHESMVGLAIPPSTEMVAGTLAILKAGGAYLPLDAGYPQERLALMFRQAQISTLLTHSTVVDQLPAFELNFINCLILDEDDAADQPVENLDVPGTPDNLAYVIFTSGSTGTPKCTLLSHRGLCNLAAEQARQFEAGPGSRVLQFAPTSFDASVWEMVMALANGGELCLAPREDLLPGPDLTRVLGEMAITHVTLPPSSLANLAASELPGLRWLIAAGEACPPGLVEAFAGGRHFYNAYGPTETTVCATMGRCIQGDAKPTIGRPLANFRTYIMDPWGTPCPVGINGELWLGGAGLARGYGGRADLTAACFVPDPFGPAGSRCYRTGDLARYLPNGNIDFSGRIDDQVKVRGFRIEPGEIEAAMAQHPEVGEAVVVCRADDRDDKRLIGYFCALEQAKIPAATLRTHLLEQLPSYLVPTQFVQLESFPHSPSGKIDRAALPSPETVFNQKKGSHVPPRGTAETILAEITAGILGLTRISMTDNFFELGGDSILSIRVVAQARERGLNFEVQDLFHYQSIGELVKGLGLKEDHQVTRKTTAPFSLIGPEDQAKLPDNIEDAYPLTRLQAGMIYHHEFNPETDIYHSVLSFHLKLQLDLSALETSIRLIVARHPVLRTTFDLKRFSQPLQLVHTSVEVPVEVQDVTHLSAEEQEQAMPSWMEAAAHWRFKWDRPPLMSVIVHRRSGSGFQFTFTIPHAIFDGWSDALFLTELYENYNSLLAGKPTPDRPVPTTRYSDFVALELASLNAEQDRSYWQEKLLQAPFLEVPRESDSERGAAPEFNVSQVPMTNATIAGLNQLAKERGVPLKTLLLTVHLKVMSLLGGRNDVLTGMVSNGRPETVDGDRVIGLFLNTLPLRFVLEPESWNEMVDRVYQTETEILAHRRYPLAQIQQDQGGRSLFETSFNFTRFHAYRELGEEAFGEVVGGEEIAENNFTLSIRFSVDPFSNDIVATLTGNIADLSQALLERVRAYYRDALEAVVAAPTCDHHRIELLTVEERERMLVDWNQTSTEQRPYLVHRMFEDQATRTPASKALIFESEELDYEELNLRAESLADQLRALGLGPESRVGLYLERSTAMFAAMLAVFKTGAMYLPLDPDNPEERMAFMLADAEPAVLLTSSTFTDKLKRWNLPKLYLDRPGQNTHLAANPVRAVDPNNGAYMIYTSGSSGRPKAVVIPHRAICNRLAWMQENDPLGHEDRVLQKTPFSFDVSVWETLWPLTSGACLVVAKPGGHQDPEYLGEMVRRHKITTLHFVPTMLRAFLDQAPQTGPFLKRVISGGENLSPELRDRCMAALRVDLFNMYAPTEALGVVYHRCLGGERGQVPIGKPIANTGIYILSSQLEPLAQGVAGELSIAGTGVSRGYYRRPGLTAAHFVPHPFSASSGDRLYRTGDRALYRADGNIEFLGRRDNQVKVRGYRIELNEIEACLLGNNAVEETVVLVQDDEQTGLSQSGLSQSGLSQSGLSQSGLSRLVAYFVSKANAAVDTTTLRAFLVERLPEYMIPAALVHLEALPLLPNGKIDRRKLPDLERRHLDVTNSFAEPTNAFETAMAAICAEVFGLDNIGMDDDFLKVGGNSILFIQLVLRVREQLGIKLKLQQVFQFPNLVELCAVLEPQADREQQEPVSEPLGRSQSVQLEDLDDLSDEDVEALLEAELADDEFTPAAAQMKRSSM